MQLYDDARWEFLKLLEKQEEYWKQRAKQFSLREGDKNTRFFHKFASTRKRNNQIKRLKDDNGEWKETNEEDVKEGLTAEITSEEVKVAVFSMHPEKSPGSDGLNPAFFQAFWSIVGKDVVHFCQKFMRTGELPIGVNCTLVCLIPKVKNPQTMSILDAHKLTGPNYADWLRNLRIVLRIEKLEYVIDSPKPTEPASDAHNDEHVVYRKWIDDANVAQCIMLASMNIELQKQHEHMDAHTILMHLQELYDVAGRTARYEISKELFGCRMSEGSSVNDHVLKMINLIERLGQLGFAMDGELSQKLGLAIASEFVLAVCCELSHE
ncbi:hypothetical protein AgCh_010940 [Apium graveolens]